MLTDLAKVKNKVVGTKQTLKVIYSNKAVKVFVADDIDKRIKNKILKSCQNKNISIEIVDSKMKLGRECGIDVSAACAAILK